jgi:peptide subunit release factor RF-3
MVNPEEAKFSGFVFKIHANIDPRHRDRIAFLRVCSGKFERNKFFHHVRLNKDFRFSSPATFMAQEKNIIEEAWPGDVIGYRPKSAHNTSLTSKSRGKNPKFGWLDWNENEKKGTFIAFPERENVPENIKEQLIVELYSK